MKKPCCQDKKNLELKHHDALKEVLQQCKICGAKHYTLTADPIDFSVIEK